jgi:hypothetical protein
VTDEKELLFYNELTLLEPSSKFSIQLLESQLNQFKNITNFMQAEFDFYKNLEKNEVKEEDLYKVCEIEEINESENNIKILKKVEKALIVSLENLNSLSNKYEDLNVTYKSMLKFFAEDEDKEDQELLMIILNFIVDFKKSITKKNEMVLKKQNSSFVNKFVKNINTKKNQEENRSSLSTIKVNSPKVVKSPSFSKKRKDLIENNENNESPNKKLKF